MTLSKGIFMLGFYGFSEGGTAREPDAPPELVMNFVFEAQYVKKEQLRLKSSTHPPRSRVGR